MTGLDRLWDTKKRLDEINHPCDPSGNNLQSKAAKFEDRHRRLTIYLENEVFADLQALRSQGIRQSPVVNLALKEFFAKHLPTEQP